jgi:hypothetical protein
MGKCVFKVRSHQCINGVHVYPDTKDNRTLGKRIEIELDEHDAKRFGNDVYKAEQPRDSRSGGPDQPATATESK